MSLPRLNSSVLLHLPNFHFRIDTFICQLLKKNKFMPFFYIFAQKNVPISAIFIKIVVDLVRSDV